MLAFHFLHYKITMDPIYAFQFLNHAWATEPVGTLSIFITFTGIVLTLGFKILDIFWEMYKERARAGKVRIELSGAQNVHGQTALVVVISNVGKEPLVVRDIGYAKMRLWGTEFIPVTQPEMHLPRALNARDLVQVTIPDNLDVLCKLTGKFQIKDSVGKIWDAPDNEIRKAKRQLKALKIGTCIQAAVNELSVVQPISTQN